MSHYKKYLKRYQYLKGVRYKIYDNDDKYKALLYYLPNETTQKLKTYEFVNDLSNLFMTENDTTFKSYL